jgi:hypothetical protein
MENILLDSFRQTLKTFLFIYVKEMFRNMRIRNLWHDEIKLKRGENSLMKMDRWWSAIVESFKWKFN